VGTSSQKHERELKGDWAKMLLVFHGHIQAAQNIGAAELKYYGAETIKQRFKE
jgi:hypothetical protein